MFHAIRTRINATTIVAIVALVFAMTGGAYAAKKYLITSTKQISPSVLKSLQGKSGAAGAAGVAGAQGPAGPAGSAGAKGETGPAGKNGAQGNEGPQGKQGATGATGTKGEKGEKGTTGFTKTLPPGDTETGAWAFGEIPAAAVPASNLGVPISFNIPLAATLDGSHCFRKAGGFVNASEEPGTCSVHLINVANKEVSLNIETFEPEEFASGQCHGTAAAPSADAGNLCVYTGKLEKTEFTDIAIRKANEENEVGASTVGAVFQIHVHAEGQGYGSWAVTAEE